MNSDSTKSQPGAARVRVVPNRNTVGLLALLVAMWYAGASQNNGAAYLLGFIVTGIALVSILHAGRNLRGLRIGCGPIAPVFAGEVQRVPLLAFAAPGATHAAIRIKSRDASEPCAFSEVKGATAARTDLWLDRTVRGRFDEQELSVHSLYPLGFFSARFTAKVRHPRWVYPKAEGTLPMRCTPLAANRHGSGMRLEGDDFAGLRAYVPGEPQRHIDWKSVARGHGLVIKQWAGEADECLHLAWADTAGLPHEARLSQLARWIVAAERASRAYSLAVPGSTIGAGRGDAHFHECLRVLAAFPREEEMR